jgi:hypothetical protein
MAYEYPMVYVNGEVDRMIPIEEFFDRLVQSSKQEGRKGYNSRGCDNEQELENFEILKK